MIVDSEGNLFSVDFEIKLIIKLMRLSKSYQLIKINE